MRYRIRHSLHYTYPQPVQLSPQVVRLHPRSDCAQAVECYELQIDPPPQRLYSNIALDGSTETILLPPAGITALYLQMETVVRTYRDNPFDFLLEPWAVTLPLEYPHRLRQELQPYLATEPPDPAAIALAQELWLASDAQVVPFLWRLNQTIHDKCTHIIRPTGAAWPAGLTWQRREGACRDLTMLFIAVCRAMGLAARFVSGYHEGDPSWPHRHLHAWAEVYLPGAGWRGYDPTHGLAVNDRYVALTARPYPQDTLPLTGQVLTPGVTGELTYNIAITPVSAA
ncbi:MAG: transglutaminase family protein [Gloeomargarita sp. SKYBB_i_bin120]|nr:transglutaminase family protein [Gloeomargarita sp. SKYG98]MCS7292383.1 transglutaminase family protein [Gloeomargarita sp. SKYB120]MDW8177943.1 transglutaminase family protein [Gloeomargarita sp. SKYBB_i_bin120]